MPLFVIGGLESYHSTILLGEIDLLIDDGIIQNNPSKIFMFEADEAKQIR